jgi:hypothetical protein
MIYGYIDENSKRKDSCDRAVRHVTEALGGTVRSKRNVAGGGDAIVVWGWKPNRTETRLAIQQGVPVIVLENVLWNRTPDWETFSVCFNGLHGGGWIPAPGEAERYHPELKPWKNGYEDRITIFKQLPNDASLRGADMDEWVKVTEHELKFLYPGREIVVRDHPASLPSWEQADESLQEAFDKTGLAVTFSSTTGGEAVIEGIPTIALHPGSPAWDVSEHRLSARPYQPDRSEWIREQSYRHWNVNEPFDGEWLLTGLEEAREQARRGEYDITDQP